MTPVLDVTLPLVTALLAIQLVLIHYMIYQPTNVFQNVYSVLIHSTPRIVQPVTSLAVPAMVPLRRSV